MSIKTFLKSHQAMDYWLRCFMNCRNPRFVETVRAIGRDPNLLYFERRGEEHPDVSFYDVYIDCPSKGFFALLLQTLDALRYAQRFYLTPSCAGATAACTRNPSRSLARTIHSSIFLNPSMVLRWRI